MRLKNVLIVVNDMEKSKAFYRKLFGLEVILDSDANAVLTEGLVLQEAHVWKQALGLEILPFHHASELYFEEADMEGFMAKLEQWGEEMRYVTPLTEGAPGQKMVRFYDPDGNLIEVRTPGHSRAEGGK